MPTSGSESGRHGLGTRRDRDVQMREQGARRARHAVRHVAAEAAGAPAVNLPASGRPAAAPLDLVLGEARVSHRRTPSGAQTVRVEDVRVEAQAKPGLTKQARHRALLHQSAVVEDEEVVWVTGRRQPIRVEDTELVDRGRDAQSDVLLATPDVVVRALPEEVYLVELVTQRELVARDTYCAVRPLALDEGMGVTLTHTLLHVDERALAQVLGAAEKEEEGDQNGEVDEKVVVCLEPQAAVVVDVDDASF